jgi:hypothetical protein
MLNTEPLREERVSFFCIVSCSIAEKNIREEERFCSIHMGHTLQGKNLIAEVSIVTKLTKIVKKISATTSFFHRG